MKRLSSPLLRAAAAVALTLAPAALSAKTVYVDCGLADYAGHDGSSPALAVKTLQEGVAKAASGDVVSVAAGTYREGVAAATSKRAAYRVRIDKPLTLRGAGRDVTHIVGELASTTTRIGSGAVGGIIIASDAATGTRIEGFTIRDCGDSKNTDGGNGAGTAIHSQKTGKELVMSDRPWVVDCAISNIYASIGAVDYVNVARTTFERCVGHSFASAADYCDLIYCTVANQRQDSNNHTFRGVRSADGSDVCNRIVNCTVYGATSSVNAMSASGPHYLQNSILEYGGVFSREIDSCVLASDRGSVGNMDNPVTPASTNETATSVFGVADGVIAGGLVKDFRPIEATTLLVGTNTVKVAASPALWLGNTNNLSVFPEEFRWKDVYGNPVVPNAEGRIHAGAVQVTMKPVAGFVVDKSWCTYLKVNGASTLQGVTRTIYTDVFPVLYRLDLPKDTEMAAWGVSVPFFGLWTQDDGVQNRYVFPDSTGQIPFVPAKGRRMTITLHQGTHVYYVDAAKEDGNAKTGSGTEADPYARIQTAIDAMPKKSGNRAVIFVAPGTYDKDLTTPTRPHPKCRLRFDSNVAHYRLVGTGGAEKTIIPGAADTSEWAEGGCLSTNAIRCVHVANAISVALQGFTLTGGHTAKVGELRDNGTVVNWGNSYGRGGAFWAGNSPNGWLIECIVTNNVAYSGGAAIANGNAVKCYFADNRLVTGGSVFDIQGTDGIWRLSSCVVNETDPGRGDVFLQSNGKGYAVNCTILGDAEKTVFFNSNSVSFFMNCILAHGRPQSAETGYRRLQGTFVWDFNYTGGKGNNYTKADPQFADEVGGDYRLLPNSPALGGGNAWTACDTTSWDRDLAYKGYYRFLSCDMEGNLPIFRDGNPSAGAYQAVSDKIALTTSVSKSGAVSVSPSGRTVIPAGAPFTVTAADGSRQVVGLKVNGEFRPGVRSVTFTPSELGSDEIFVEAVASTNWYVDAVSGSDANPGWTEDAACLTLTGVLARAESGDVVTALPGVYDQGSAIHTNQVYFYDEITDTIRLPSRAVVPAKVSLVSRDGAAATTIKGAFGSNADGTGEGAVRCVFLNKGAILRGFTLTGGGTLKGSTEYRQEFFDNVAGGAVLSADTPFVSSQAGAQPRTTGYVEDCVITGNSACDSAVCYGSYVHCRFTGNRTAAIREAHYLYGCVIGGNSVGGASCAVYQPYFVDDCTFLGGDVRNSGTEAEPLHVYPNSANWIVRNSIFLTARASVIKNAFNCRGKYSSSIYASNESACWENVSCDETLAVDDDCRPARTCAAVDAWRDGRTATTNLFQFATPAAFVRATDFAGGARVYNGRQDVGAGEHDWRARYRDDLGGGGRLRVTAASSGVVEEDVGVALADGETLTAAYRSRAAGTGACEWQVEVEGEGSLTVSVNGGAAQPVSTGAFSPALVEGANTFVFAYAGSGRAVLKKFRSYAGGYLILK